MTELTITEVYAIGLPIILAMILVETLFSGLNKKSLYKNKDTLCTSGLLLGNILMGFAIKGATLGLHIFLYQFRVFDLVNVIPLWAMWLMTFILIDFVFYIYHRFSHRVRFYGQYI